ncbi:MAG: glycosyltransferase, partial [Gammaproteobacteria bacterium]|nr:glycosyltransferase [Gammaproteobacteria bacterium]
MNILELHNTWDDAEPGGVVSMLTDLMDGLAARHRVELLVSDWRAAATSRSVDSRGRHYYRLRLPGPPRAVTEVGAWLQWPWRFTRAVRQLLAICRAHDIDLIHLHYP